MKDFIKVTRNGAITYIRRSSILMIYEKNSKAELHLAGDITSYSVDQSLQEVLSLLSGPSD